MKLWVQHAGFVDPILLHRAGVHLVATAGEADYTVWITDLPSTARGRAIMIYSEPPLCEALAEPYAHPERFHTCFLFGSIPGALPITEDPLVYPYMPDTCRDRWRKSVTLGADRKIFYAGTRVGYLKWHDAYGRVGLYETRNALVETLRSFGWPIQAEGIGWDRESRRAPNWSDLKVWMARGSGASFILCMENSILRHYVTEKLHHGFQSDLVVLYLGDPRVTAGLPSEAFIDLHQWYDPATKRVDATAVARHLHAMTQEQYDGIVLAARKWRQTDLLEERRQRQIERVTRIILERLR